MADTFRNWEEYLELLKPGGALTQLTWEPGSDQLRAELYRQMFMNLSVGYFLFFQGDPDYPDFTPYFNSVFLLQPNPDDTYYLAPVRGDATYRLTAERGSVYLLLFNVGTGICGMPKAGAPALPEFSADALNMDSDGRFEIVFSARRPLFPCQNWVELHPGAQYVLVRQRSYDWGNERDARLAIERVGANTLKPRLSENEIHRRMSELVNYGVEYSRQWLVHVNGLRDRGYINKIEFTHFQEYGGGVRKQTYWWGAFDFGPGEALIVETELPEKRPYWNIQLNDPLWNAVEYIYRQSSLNGHQARVDSDGKFRAVISLEDPQVPNWLDPGGYNLGTIVGRWYDCSSLPEPTIKKVQFKDVRKHLPADTPSMSAEQRSVVLSARIRGSQLRRRW
jgi:hypothetical protein